ncbi:hypothetical protein BpHYR1_050039 [Brachionus plicatilis]|uniref:Uncharacterized protein n=1 Tax=Brachionus plicatilis TaxID=10195 RepID=A0A3M7R692_BRAPC|nr:hypothetical protein BpHYR1_050039 [Brachionus plicatilis]
MILSYASLNTMLKLKKKNFQPFSIEISVFFKKHTVYEVRFGKRKRINKNILINNYYLLTVLHKHNNNYDIDLHILNRLHFVRRISSNQISTRAKLFIERNYKKFDILKFRIKNHLKAPNLVLNYVIKAYFCTNLLSNLYPQKEETCLDYVSCFKENLRIISHVPQMINHSYNYPES